MTKTLPRFTRNQRRPNADEIVRPLPPTLLKLVEHDDVAIEHEKVAVAYSEARTKIASLATAYEDALVADEQEQRAAIHESRAAKQAKAPKLADDLERARRQLDTASDLLDESSAALLIASIPYVRRAVAEVEQIETQALDECEELLAGVLACFERAARSSSESGWLAELAVEGHVHPFDERLGAPPWRAYAEANGTLRRLRHEREEQAQRVEQIERERAAADSIRVAGEEQIRRLPAAPGREVWVLPESVEPARKTA